MCWLSIGSTGCWKGSRLLIWVRCGVVRVLFLYGGGRFFGLVARWFLIFVVGVSSLFFVRDLVFLDVGERLV